MFCKKGVLRNFTRFTGKHLFQSLFFNNVAGPRSPTLLKKRPWHRCVPVNFVKILRTFFYRTPPRDCLCTLFIHYILSVFITDVTTIICPLHLLLINSRPKPWQEPSLQLLWCSDCFFKPLLFIITCVSFQCYSCVLSKLCFVLQNTRILVEITCIIHKTFLLF